MLPRRVSIKVVSFAWLVLFTALQASAITLWKPQLNNKNREEIIVRRIVAPDLDIMRCSIDDTGLHYDYHSENDNTYRYGPAFYYVATLKGESQIIGKVEVGPDWKEGKYQEILQGIELNHVETAPQYKRMGVGTALFRAIERDSSELMQSMETFLCKSNPAIDVEKRSDGRILLRLMPVDTKQALCFYQSLGFQWEDNEDGLATKLRMSWHYIKGDLYLPSPTNSGYLVKAVKP